MDKPFISIIGLGTTGSSIGRALRKEQGNYVVVGHDKKSGADSDSKRAGAIDRSEWNLHRAVEGSSLVVIALPLSEVGETLRLIEEDIAENSLVLIFSPLLKPALHYASHYLPRHRRAIAAHIVASVAGDDDDPVPGSTICIAAPVDAEEAAVELASDFADRVGATPYFVDADEHDGIVALVEQMPQLLGATLLEMATQSPGWQESRRIAGSRFAHATDMGGSAQALAATLLANRESMYYTIGVFQDALEGWKAYLDPDTPDSQPPPLVGALDKLFAERATWEEQAITRKWDEEAPAAAPPGTSGMFRQLFLGNFGRRKPPASQ